MVVAWVKEAVHMQSESVLQYEDAYPVFLATTAFLHVGDTASAHRKLQEYQTLIDAQVCMYFMFSICIAHITVQFTRRTNITLDFADQSFDEPADQACGNSSKHGDATKTVADTPIQPISSKLQKYLRVCHDWNSTLISIFLSSGTVC